MSRLHGASEDFDRPTCPLAQTSGNFDRITLYEYP